MLSGLEELILFGFVPLMVGVLVWPSPSGSEERTVTGKIVVAPQDVLPEGSTVVVELIEYPRGESPGPALAREVMLWRGLPSQTYAVRVDPSLLRPMTPYALQAHVMAEGAILFETRYPLPAAPLTGIQVTLTLVPATARG